MKQNPLLLLKGCRFTQITSGHRLRYEGTAEDSHNQPPHMVDHVFVREDDTLNHPYEVNTYYLLKTVRIEPTNIEIDIEEVIKYLHAIYPIDVDDFDDFPDYLKHGMVETQNVLLNQKRAFTFLLFNLVPAFIEDIEHSYDNYLENLQRIDKDQEPQEIVDEAQDVIRSDRDDAKETQEKLQRVLHITKTHSTYLDDEVYNTEEFIFPLINKMAANDNDFDELSDHYERCSNMCNEIDSMQEKLQSIRDDIDNEVEDFLNEL